MRGQRDLAEFLTSSLHPDAPLVLNEGSIIACGYDEELDRLRSIGADGKQWLADFQAREIESTGIPSLKAGFNNVFGYYIEITNTHHDRVPAHYVRKQTLKNAERYITDELKKYETEVLTARDKAIAREQKRWIRLACAFPCSPTTQNRRGIDRTDWIRIDRRTYDACIDRRDYRPKPKAGSGLAPEAENH